MVKIQEIKYKDKNSREQSKFIITLPSNIVKLKNLKKGDEINFREENGKYFIEFERK